MEDQLTESVAASKQENESAPRIVLKHIHKTYNKKQALAIPTMEIPLEGIVAIVGWSGSGKSTLLNILSLIDHPDPAQQGNIPSLEYHLPKESYHITYQRGDSPTILRRRGQREDQLDEASFRRKVFGFVFQEHYLHPNLDVEYNVKMPLLTRSKTVPTDALAKISGPLGIANHMHKHIDKISGGQAQRAAILRGLLKHSPLVFGDELTSNIDHEMARKVLDGIEHMLTTSDHPMQAFLWVSHDINLIKDYAHKIVTIQAGKVACTDNHYADNPNGILELLREESDTSRDEDIKPISQDNATLWERIHYHVSYAYRDLFKGIWPTIDFTVIVLSLVFVNLFLLSIFKISYGSSKFLELKLSDPRINSLEVQATEKLGGELTVQHYEQLAAQLADSVRYITPIYWVRTSIADLRRDGNYRSLSNGFTFRQGDPIIREILGERTAPFVDDPKNWQGVVMRTTTIERYGYKSTAQELNIKFNTFNLSGEQRLPATLVDMPLPFDKKVMMREEFYLENYRRNDNEARPDPAFIVVYPKNIYDTMTIKQRIEADGRFEVIDAFKVFNKIQLIDEMKKQTKLFVVLSLAAIIVMSFLFIQITIFRNLYKKRREIGVFLAYGMRRTSLYMFYLAETIMISLAALLLSLALYLLGVEPLINNMLAQGGLTQIAGVTELGTIIDPAALRIPTAWMLKSYLGSFIVLLVLYFYWITRFSRMKPIQLLKEY